MRNKRDVVLAYLVGPLTTSRPQFSNSLTRLRNRDVNAGGCNTLAIKTQRAANPRRLAARSKAYKGVRGVSTPRGTAEIELGVVGRTEALADSIRLERKGERPELNRRPPEPQSGALTN